MTTDTTWTDTLPAPDGASEEQVGGTQAREDAARRRGRKAALAVLVSLVALAGLAVGLVLFFGAAASAVGGCGGAGPAATQPNR
ncbi:hypothetical protein ABH931_002324 [Streptacidiphilus sp. MAP12-33]|uniref:hypothetical protein n=1 Tax=Streptacidiphilus sp. MAP12-33 TaxID=3156266 RepID=UPI003514B2BD